MSSLALVLQAEIGFERCLVAKQFVIICFIRTDGQINRRVQVHPGDVTFVVVIIKKCCCASFQKVFERSIVRKLRRFLHQACRAAKVARVAAASPSWNSMLRTTCVATQLEGGHARNALPQLAAANVNCRVLPEDSVEYVQNTLTKIFNDPQVQIKIEGEVVRGPASPLDPELMRTIRRVTDTIWPGVPVLPVLLTGATDGLYLRSAGIPTYGIQGFFVDRNDVRAHGRDERMGVQSFYEGEKFLYELVKALSSNNSL